MAGPEQFGRLSIWGSLKNLFNNRIAWFTGVGVPVDGTAGALAGKAGPGSEYIDLTTGIHYTNLGTLASPVWSGSAIVGGTGGLGTTGNAKMTYDFTVDAGAISTITPANSPSIPINAIILGGVIDVTVPLTSGGAATVALGFGSGAQAAALKAATGFASFTTTTLPLIELFTAATYFKLTATARMTLTIAAATLTAGRFDVNLVYVQGN